MRLRYESHESCVSHAATRANEASPCKIKIVV